MLGAGAVDYITKPFFLPELKARIRKVFRFKRIHDDFVAMKQDLIKERLATPFGDTRKIIPETLDDNVAVIFKSLAEIRQAIQNIDATVGNVDFLESTIMDLCARISNIMEAATPAGKGQ